MLAKMELWQSLTINLLIPFVMIVFGLWFRRGGPKKVNWWCGYRTSMASKNQDTWVFAHRYVGRLFVPVGVCLMIFSVGITLWLEHREISPEWSVGVIALLGLVALLTLLIPTEMALRKVFDKHGQRR